MMRCDICLETGEQSLAMGNDVSRYHGVRPELGVWRIN
jgi:hypothetical protein